MSPIGNTFQWLSSYIFPHTSRYFSSRGCHASHSTDVSAVGVEFDTWWEQPYVLPILYLSGFNREGSIIEVFGANITALIVNPTSKSNLNPHWSLFLLELGLEHQVFNSALIVLEPSDREPPTAALSPSLLWRSAQHAHCTRLLNTCLITFIIMDYLITFIIMDYLITWLVCTT